MCKFGYFKNRIYRCILDHGNICDYNTSCERNCDCPNWQDHMDSEKLEVFENNENYQESLAEENRIYGEILEENFFFELTSIKSYKAEAKIDKFESVLPDTSDIEEF